MEREKKTRHSNKHESEWEREWEKESERECERVEKREMHLWLVNWNNRKCRLVHLIKTINSHQNDSGYGFKLIFNKTNPLTIQTHDCFSVPFIAQKQRSGFFTFRDNKFMKFSASIVVFSPMCIYSITECEYINSVVWSRFTAFMRVREGAFITHIKYIISSNVIKCLANWTFSWIRIILNFWYFGRFMP